MRKEDIERKIQTVSEALKTFPFEDLADVEKLADVTRGTVAGMSALVSAGASVTLSIMPQLPFRAKRVVFDSETASAFELVDFRVGKNSQFLTADPIHGEALAGEVPKRCPTCGRIAQDALVCEHYVGSVFNPHLASFKFDTCNIGQLMTAQVRNISDKAETIRIAFEGRIIADY